MKKKVSVKILKYKNSLLTFLFQQCQEKFIVTNYMDGQMELTSDMRAILVDWLVEVQVRLEIAALRNCCCLFHFKSNMLKTYCIYRAEETIVLISRNLLFGWQKKT